MTERLDVAHAENVAHDAVRAARAYFCLSDEWEISMREDELERDVAAEITPQVDYHRAYITYNLRTMDSLEQLWVRIGHEVAHLVLIEQRLFFSALEDHMQGDIPASLVRLWIHADERAVSRLERMFARDKPLPQKEATP